MNGWLKNERGIALVVVLWTMLLLGVIAASFVREIRVETALARNLTESAKAEMLAEAGIQRAMLGLLDPNEATAWRADGTVHEFSFGDGIVRLRVQNEAGKIDLNHAPRELLFSLFVHLGLDADQAASLAVAIRGSAAEAPLDSSDDVRTGAQDGAYDRFQSLEDMMSLTEVSRDFYELIAPNVTVYSGSPEVDATSAPPLVLQVLREVSAEQHQVPDESEVETASVSPFAQTVTVSADAVTTSGGVFGREVVLRRTDDVTHPFQTLVWRQRWRKMP